MPARPRTTIRPVKIREYSAALHVAVVRGVGFRARCDCGWSGSVRSTMRAARGDLGPHLVEHLDDPETAEA